MYGTRPRAIPSTSATRSARSLSGATWRSRMWAFLTASAAGSVLRPGTNGPDCICSIVGPCTRVVGDMAATMSAGCDPAVYIVFPEEETL